MLLTYIFVEHHYIQYLQGHTFRYRYLDRDFKRGVVTSFIDQFVMKRKIKGMIPARKCLNTETI